MHDLTKGPITPHLIRLATPMAAGMIFQTLYFLVDLYFVARLGDAAIAGVSAAGNVQFIIMALTQVLGVGTMALDRAAVGPQGRADANLIFNQSRLLARSARALTLVARLRAVALVPRRRSAPTRRRSKPVSRTCTGSCRAWRCSSRWWRWARRCAAPASSKPTMVVQVLTVVLNAVLAPMLIAGWGTGRPMGVAGAGLASSISIAVGVVMMLRLLRAAREVRATSTRSCCARAGRLEAHPRDRAAGRRRVRADVRLHGASIYWIIRGFGAEAQAGFGIGGARDAGDLPAGDGGGVRDGAGRRARTSAPAARPRAGDVPRGGDALAAASCCVLTLLCQVEAEAMLVGSSRRTRPSIAVGAQIPAHHLVELRGVRR